MFKVVNKGLYRLGMLPVEPHKTNSEGKGNDHFSTCP